MYIAAHKRKTNISEYLIYMFQVEDLIRSFHFNIDLIDQQIIQKFDLPYNYKRDMREWYAMLIYGLLDKDCKERGHGPFLKTIMDNMNDLHIKLLSIPEERAYHQLYQDIKTPLAELRLKAGASDKHDITVCLEGLYGLLLLRLSKKKINPETEKAFEKISKMLSYLSVRYKDIDEETEL